MKQILVTGGAGFIGSHLTERLLARGDRVTVVDDESTGSAANLAAVAGHPRLTYIRGSIAEAPLAARLVAEADEIYHLAAAVGVRLIAEAPIRTIETNIHATQLLLHELQSRHDAGHPVKFFLASSSEVYGKNPKPRWTEKDDLMFGPTTRARWSYGASKAIDEFLVLAHHRQYGLPAVIGRFFNVVGPRQTGAFGMVLPRFVDAALAGEALQVHDDGKQTRCFAHVSDVVTAVLQLMDHEPASGGVYNIGSDAPVSILELAEQVIDLAGVPRRIEFQSYAEAYSEDFEDIRTRVPDLSRLKSTIPFQLEYDLRATILDVIEHKRANLAR